MMGAAAQTLFDFEFGLSSYMRLEINMPLFAARRTVLSAAAAAALLVLTGCSKSDDAKSSASSADTLEKPTLVVGMELAYPPFEGKDEQGNPAGVSVDFMKDFAKSAGKAIKIENIAFDGLIPALLTGKVDMVMSSMTITDERRKTVDFSDPYANAMLGILTHKGSGIKSVEDLNQKGRRIAAKIGSTGYLYAQNNLKNAAVTALPDESACVMEVATGKADGFIYDQLTITATGRRTRRRRKPFSFLSRRLNRGVLPSARATPSSSMCSMSLLLTIASRAVLIVSPKST